MALGALKGTLTGSGPSVTNPSSITGSVSVAVGDLIFCVFCQQTALTATGATDNLGNTYTPQNAGSDTGTATGRAFYSRVTVAGTLTSIDIAATASANDYSGVAGVFEGPVVAPPIDANPANGTADATSPFTCPATGTLAQASEIVIAWAAVSAADTWAATSPNLLAGQLIPGTSSTRSVLGYQTVAATTSVVPEFTAAGNPAQSATLGTCSFKAASVAAYTLAADAGSYSVTGSVAGLAAARKLAAATGSYVLTGSAAGLAAGRKISAVAGAYALTGSATGLGAGRKIAAASGVYALTGSAAGLKAARKIAAATGAYVLTGSAASLVYSPVAGSYILAADAGIYALIGSAAGLAAGRKVAALAGSYSLTGSAAALRADRRLVAATGLYTLTGSAATLNASGVDICASVPRPAAAVSDARPAAAVSDARPAAATSTPRTDC